VTNYVIEALYLAASVLFILGLKGLTSPATARRGMHYAEAGMLLAIIGTLMHHEIVRYDWIIVALVLGSAIGAVISIFMPMTAVPQRTAISHMFGALAATLVGVSEYYRHGGQLDRPVMALMRGAPITYKLQNASNLTLFAVMVGLFSYLVYQPSNYVVFYTMIGIGLLIGILMVLPIGGADMPVVISLLNSYAGLASSATGFVLSNNVLIIAGALDGASGFLLSVLMSKAMNRSFRNVIFGAFGGTTAAAGAKTLPGGTTIREVSPEDAALQLGFARSVIIVPGYGMAVAQAQHQVRELADLIHKRGGTVKYAIHPVAGRMPGHMNVLLAEANVPYDQLYDMDQINDEFERADVALVVGANDVVNPAARTEPGSPIYGMPILNVDRAQHVIVLKRSMNPGFAGIENNLFYLPKTFMLFGHAKESIQKVINELKTG